jgi:DNA-binding beta-propeller fold protein YncE
MSATAQRSDGPRGTVIASNMVDHTVTILDAATGRSLATLPTGKGPHEVTVSHDGKWALVSNYGVRGEPGNSIAVIDVARRAVVRTISLAEHRRPHGMSFLPGDTLFVVTCETDRAILVVDFRDDRIQRVVPSGGRGSHMLSVSSNGRRMVVANIADGTISVVDPLVQREPRIITVARQPEGIAIAPTGDRPGWAAIRTVSCSSSRSTKRKPTRFADSAFRIAWRSPPTEACCHHDPAKAQVTIFDVAQRRPTATIQIPRDSILPAAEIPGSPSPEGVVLSRDGRWGFVTLQGRNRLVTIDLERGVIVGYAVTGNWSDGVGFSPLPP